jgi:hypothetical protein
MHRTLSKGGHRLCGVILNVGQTCMAKHPLTAWPAYNNKYCRQGGIEMTTHEQQTKEVARAAV